MRWSALIAALALCAASMPGVVRANEEVEVEIGAVSGAQSAEASAASVAAAPAKKEKKYSSAFFELQHALSDYGAAFTSRGIVEARSCRHRDHVSYPPLRENQN